MRFSLIRCQMWIWDVKKDDKIDEKGRGKERGRKSVRKTSVRGSESDASRSASRERKASTSRGPVKRKESIVEELPVDAVTEEKKEEEPVEEAVVVRSEIRSFTKSTQDFYDARHGKLDLEELPYYARKMGINSDVYCPHKFFQPPTPWLKR